MKNAPKNDKSVGAWYLARAIHKRKDFPNIFEIFEIFEVRIRSDQILKIKV